jgi:hypothetical protein
MKKYIITLLVLSLLTGKTLNAQEAPDLAVVEAIMAQPQISLKDARVVQQYYTAQGGSAQAGYHSWIAAARTIAGKSSYALSFVKFTDKDVEGWTPEMVYQNAEAAARLAFMPESTDQFRDFVWNVMVDPTKPIVAAQGPYLMRLFKQRRSALPLAEQIAVTQKQKELLLALPSRNNNANAWLAEMSADLIALSLEQQQ